MQDLNEAISPFHTSHSGLNFKAGFIKVMERKLQMQKNKK